MFVRVSSTRRNGDRAEHLIALPEIARASSKGNQTIITLNSSDVDIWADCTFDEFEEKVNQAKEELHGQL